MSGLGARVRRLEGRSRGADLRRLAEEVAAESGVGADELLADALAFAGRCAAAGATTAAEQCRLMAAELGLDPAEVLAEAEAMMAGRW